MPSGSHDAQRIIVWTGSASGFPTDGRFSHRWSLGDAEEAYVESDQHTAAVGPLRWTVRSQPRKEPAWPTWAT